MQRGNGYLVFFLLAKHIIFVHSTEKSYNLSNNFSNRRLTYQFRLLALVILVLAGLLVYFNTFEADFQLDDGFHILKKEEIKDLDNYRSIDKWLNINQRPLSTFTLALNYAMNKFDVFGYHLFNLIFHILTGLVVYLLIVQVLDFPFHKKKDIPEYRHLLGIFCALIFIVHPVQTQAVTYIIQRMAVMAGFFYLLSAYFYIRSRYLYARGAKNGRVSIN